MNGYPLAGISDLPFRMINRRFGCKLAFIPIISASAIVHGDKTGTMLFRKFFSMYTKGFTHIKPLRVRAFSAKTREEMTIVIKEIVERKAYHQQFPD